MKTTSLVLILIYALLPGCGNIQQSQSQVPAIDRAQVTIVWQGSIETSDYVEVFHGTEDCLHQKFYYPYQNNKPVLYLLSEQLFTCAGIENAVGCYVPDENAIYISSLADAVSGFPVDHETIHWMTGKMNDEHGEPEFQICVSQTT